MKTGKMKTLLIYGSLLIMTTVLAFLAGRKSFAVRQESEAREQLQTEIRCALVRINLQTETALSEQDCTYISAIALQYGKLHTNLRQNASMAGISAGSPLWENLSWVLLGDNPKGMFLRSEGTLSTQEQNFLKSLNEKNLCLLRALSSDDSFTRNATLSAAYLTDVLSLYFDELGALIKTLDVPSEN